jgi:hypothetical protein
MICTRSLTISNETVQVAGKGAGLDLIAGRKRKARKDKDLRWKLGCRREGVVVGRVCWRLSRPCDAQTFPAIFVAQAKSHRDCDLRASSHVEVCDYHTRTSLRVSRSQANCCEPEFESQPPARRNHSFGRQHLSQITVCWRVGNANHRKVTQFTENGSSDHNLSRPNHTFTHNFWQAGQHLSCGFCLHLAFLWPSSLSCPSTLSLSNKCI